MNFMYCVKCGAKLTNCVGFCTACGVKINPEDYQQPCSVSEPDVMDGASFDKTEVHDVDGPKPQLNMKVVMGLVIAITIAAFMILVLSSNDQVTDSDKELSDHTATLTIQLYASAYSQIEYSISFSGCTAPVVSGKLPGGFTYSQGQMCSETMTLKWHGEKTDSFKIRIDYRDKGTSQGMWRDYKYVSQMVEVTDGKNNVFTYRF